MVKAEKREAFNPALDEFLKYKEAHPKLFKGLKSWKLLKQEYGYPSDMYVEMWEFASLGEMEKITARIFSDKGMKKISQGFHQLIEPATFSANIWYPVV